MKSTLIVGWHRESVNLYKKIREFPALGYTIKGFVTLKKYEQHKHYQKVPLLGDLSVLTASVKELYIQEVLIAIERDEEKRLSEVIELCEKIGVHYRIVSDVYNIVYGRVTRDVFKDVFKPREIGFRRIFDFFAAMLIILLFFPLFLVISVLLKYESKGSLFISQLRIGKNEEPFRIFRFRTMVKYDEEKLEVPLWALKDNPRMTKVGLFLRQTQIDELPQLLNIMKGNMSFIGPQPESPLFVDAIKEQIPLYNQRFKIKPGITGWAQVNWKYEETIEDVKEKLRYDLYYMNNRTLILDIKIMLRTIKSLIFGNYDQT
jgi:exopolysaccharide biosynthesis polyprenyl glycosylphosphotransferase